MIYAGVSNRLHGCNEFCLFRSKHSVKNEGKKRMIQITFTEWMAYECVAYRLFMCKTQIKHKFWYQSKNEKGKIDDAVKYRTVDCEMVERNALNFIWRKFSNKYFEPKIHTHTQMQTTKYASFSTCVIWNWIHFFQINVMNYDLVCSMIYFACEASRQYCNLLFITVDLWIQKKKQKQCMVWSRLISILPAFERREREGERENFRKKVNKYYRWICLKVWQQLIEQSDLISANRVDTTIKEISCTYIHERSKSEKVMIIRQTETTTKTYSIRWLLISNMQTSN